MPTLPPPLFRMKALALSAPPKRKYGCLMAMLPTDVAKEIRDWAKANINPDHLAEEGLGDEIHVTVKYGFKDDDILDRISDICREFGRFPIRLESVSQFKGNEDGDVLKVDVEGSLLRRLNRLVSSSFDNYDKYPTYKPHLTLAYLKPEFSDLYTGISPSFLGQEVWIDKLKFSTAAKQKTTISLPEPIRIKSTSARRTPGQVWRGQSGRWFTMTPDRRVVPTKAPGGDSKPQAESGGFDFLDVSSELGKAKQAAVSTVLKLAGDVTQGTERIWNKLRVSVMKATDPKARKRLKAVARVAAAVEHQLGRFTSGTQGLVEEVVKGRNIPPKTKERVLKWTKRLDFGLKWTANIPVVTHVLHAAEVATGPAGFVLAKMGYYLPVASLAYLSYSTARDPMATLRAASAMLSREQHKSIDDGNIDVKFVNELFALYQKYDEDLVDTLLAVAIDETHDAGKAMAWVKRTLERQAVNQKALSWLSTAAGGALVKPAKQVKLPPSLFKSYWRVHIKASTREIGVPWEGNSGRWFIRRQSDGRTIPYKKPGDSSGGSGGKPTKQPAVKKPKVSVEDVRSSIDEFTAGGNANPASAKVIALAISTLTVAQINQLKKHWELRAGGNKMAMASKLAEQIIAKVNGQLKKPRKKPQPKVSDAGAGDAGRAGDDQQPPEDGGRVAEAAERPTGAATDREGNAVGKPARQAIADSIPAGIDEVNRRIDRYEKFFRSKGNGRAADWMGMLRGHINAVGAPAALESIGGASTASSDNPVVQYWGVGTEEANWKHMGDFIESYLARNGISTVTGDTSDPDLPLISALGKPDKYVADQDFKPADMHFTNKLDEAKTLPGLEASEDISELVGKPVSHLTAEVTSKLDEKYGQGKWIVKCYDDNAAAGYGIFFPQRVAAIVQEARNTVWTAGEKLAQYGFRVGRNPDTGKVFGIVHESGDIYQFGTEEYDKTIGGDARQWADRAAAAADAENGAPLPEGSFMAQPAFPALGISDEERAAGKTWHEKNEGRVHLVTRPDGNVEVVPHATWLKGGNLPVVFEDDDTRAMAKAAKEAIEKIPMEARKGQVYAPDVMKTADGYKVVELNAQGDFNGSGYLHDNQFTIDSYVSHLTGRQPMHVKFIRGLLTSRKRQEKSLGRSLFKWFVMSKANEQRQIGVPWESTNKPGRWFVRRQSDGRTVPYKRDSGGGTTPRKPAAKKPAQEKPTKQPKVKPTVDQVKAGISEFVSKGKVEPQSAQVIADSISTLTVVQINELKKQLGYKATGPKAELARKIADQILAGIKPADQDGNKPTSPELEPETQPEQTPEDVPVKVEPNWQHRDVNDPVVKDILANAKAVEAVGAIASVDAGYVELAARHGELKEENRKQLDVLWKMDSSDSSYRKLYTQYDETKSQLDSLKAQMDQANAGARQKLFEVLKPTKPPKMSVNVDHIGDKLTLSDGRVVTLAKPLIPTEADETVIKEGQEFVGNITNFDNKDIAVTYSRSSSGRASFNLLSDKKTRSEAHPNRLLNALGFRKDVEDVVYNPRIKMGESHKDGTMKTMNVSTQVHELGHMIEEMKPGVREKVHKFLAYRLSGEQPVDMATVPGGESMKGEMVRKNHFDRAFDTTDAYYVGREYKTGSGEIYGSEITAMGIQALHDDPIGFCQKDPEYAAFVIGILQQ